MSCLSKVQGFKAPESIKWLCSHVVLLQVESIAQVVVTDSEKNGSYDNINDMKDGLIKVAAASPELKVADTAYNGEKIRECIASAIESHVRLLVLPELCITGYTCADLFFQRSLQLAALEELERIAKCTEKSDLLVLVGLPYFLEGKLYNVAAVLFRGRVLAFIPKSELPTYSEFYERRWFTPASEELTRVSFSGYEVPFGKNILIRASGLPEFTLGVEICEDLWVPSSPSLSHALAGATVIANLSASDELIGKREYRRNLVSMQSAKLVCAYIYADASDGESSTDMVFTGHDLIAENGSVLAESFLSKELLISEVDVLRLSSERMKQTTYPQADTSGYEIVTIDLVQEETVLTRYFSPQPFVPATDAEIARRCEEIITLQSLGLKKRLSHTNARTAVIGLSGGLDSTLALLVTVKAFDMLGRDRKDILAITMPCFGTTKRTRSNAELLANALKVSFAEIDITSSVRQHFKDIGQSETEYDVTFENGQARERTQVLMDLANKNGGLVIGTGDLSELALGWATYNGDHMSMYAVNASVPKTLVRYLVRFFASEDFSGAGSVLYDILDTPVSPELLPASSDGTISQKTEDLVGPYELHDFFLYYFVRHAFTPEKIRRVARAAFCGRYDDATIDKWLRTFIRRFFSQQFKRSCLPDGPKVGTITLSPRSDWRMPSDAVSRLWLESLEE